MILTSNKHHKTVIIAWTNYNLDMYIYITLICICIYICMHAYCTLLHFNLTLQHLLFNTWFFWTALMLEPIPSICIYKQVVYIIYIHISGILYIYMFEVTYTYTSAWVDIMKLTITLEPHHNTLHYNYNTNSDIKWLVTWIPNLVPLKNKLTI